MKKEAAEAGFYKSGPLDGAAYPRPQILTIQQILDGNQPGYPARRDATFKKAPRSRPAPAENLSLPLLALQGITTFYVLTPPLQCQLCPRFNLSAMSPVRTLLPVKPPNPPNPPHPPHSTRNINFAKSAYYFPDFPTLVSGSKPKAETWDRPGQTARPQLTAKS